MYILIQIKTYVLMLLGKTIEVKTVDNKLIRCYINYIGIVNTAQKCIIDDFFYKILVRSLHSSKFGAEHK